MRNWGDKIKVIAAPHAVYTSSPEFLEYCAKLGEITIHVSETQSENAECKKKHGKTPTRLLYDLGYFRHRTVAAHCVWTEDEDMEIFIDNNVNIAHCPGSNLKLGSGVAPIDKYIKSGINVALGTDGAASNNALNMLNEIRLAALIHKGVNCDPLAVSAQTALEMATINGAKALGLETQIGRIDIGYHADLVFFETKSANMQPLSSSLAGAVVYSADRGNIWRVMVDGEFLPLNNHTNST
jgi:5-methylthioadenosine/S-adenosylhomocysteine deaminase